MQSMNITKQCTCIWIHFVMVNCKACLLVVETSLHNPVHVFMFFLAQIL